MKTHGSAIWHGGLKEGRGEISTASGALSGYPYGFASRFEGQKGSNPEELIGAAHSACFIMALTLILGEAGLIATTLDSRADVSLDKQGPGFVITASRLTLTATIPGATEQQFVDCVNKAKQNCPVSRLLKAEITLDAKLVGS
jgi:osmotically inducible protein OsmC